MIQVVVLLLTMENVAVERVVWPRDFYDRATCNAYIESEDFSFDVAERYADKLDQSLSFVAYCEPVDTI
jgi:hypothetical protein